MAIASVWRPVLLILPLALFSAAAPAAAPSTQPSLVVRWRYDAGKPLHAAPASDGKTIFIADSEGTVMALDCLTHERKWSVAGSADVSSGLVLADSRLIVADEEGLVRALSPENGKELWRFAAAGKIVSRPLWHEGRLYVGSYDENLYALELASGKLLWKFKTAAQVHAAPTLADGNVLIAGCDGQLRAIDAQLGGENWATEIGDPIATSPRVKNGVAFIGTLKGEGVAVEIEKGKIKWRSSGRETRGEPIMAAASFERDGVTFTTQEGVRVTHSQSDGQWQTTRVYRGRLSTDGAEYGGDIWYASEEGKLFGTPSKSGQPVFTAGGGIKASPVVIGDELLVVDESGMLWGLGSR